MSKLKEYIKEVEEEIRKLKELNPSDRLAFMSALEQSLYNIHGSTIGWHSWIKSPGIMAKFSKEELAGYFERMREYAVLFLELDLKATRQMQSKGLEKEDNKELSYVQ